MLHLHRNQVVQLPTHNGVQSVNRTCKTTPFEFSQSFAQDCATHGEPQCKVIVIGNDETGHLVAELFRSELRMWISVSSSSDIFFRFHYKWGPDPWDVVEDPDDPLEPLNVALSPCMYDCEQGQFLEHPVDSQNLYKHINGKT